MAQHIPLYSEEYEKIFISVRSIGKYLVRGKWYLGSRKPFDVDLVHRKEIKLLPKDYFTREDDFFVLTIKPYKLRKKDFQEYAENAELECHFNKQGEITNIYYPL